MSRSRSSALSAFFAVKLAVALAAPAAATASEIVVDFESAEPGKWIASYAEHNVTFALARAPEKTKAAGRMVVFPHPGTERKGILCAMATEPIPVEARFPTPASSVTVKFWASTGCAARLEALDQNGNVVDHASLAAAPARAAPGDPMPTFELTVRAPAIASIRFSGPREGEYLAADEIRIR